jgi:endoglucanase
MKFYQLTFLCLAANLVFAQTPMFDFNKTLGKGINLGNVFEAPSETEWGNPFRDDYMSRIKSQGFGHVRMPIRWDVPARAQMTSPFTVNATFLARVKYVVDLAIKEDMKIIINMHHHDDLFANPAANKARFLSQWQQIASYFKDYPNDKLIFEVLNEPHGQISPELWNVYFADALAEIRKTNAKRPVLMGTAEYGGIAGIFKLVPPNDPNIIVSVHYYNPFNFTHQGADWVGTDAKNWLGTKWNDTQEERDAVKSEVEALIDFSKRTNIPIHMGEFGAYSTADMASRARWTTYIARYFESIGFSWAYWEWSAGFGIFNPSSNTYNSPLVNALIKNPLPAPTRTILTKVYQSNFTTNTDGWSINNANGARSTISASNGELNIKIDAIGTASWNVQMIKAPIALTKDKTYRLSFEGKSTTSNGFTYYAGKASDPWNSYSGYASPQMTTEYKEYSTVFSMTSPTDLSARISFDLATKIGNLTIRNIKLEEVTLDFSSSLDKLGSKPITVYPNPALDELTLSGLPSSEVTISVYDMGGKEVMRRANFSSNTLDIKHLATGTYTIILTTSKEVFSSKFVKK